MASSTFKKLGNSQLVFGADWSGVVAAQHVIQDDTSQISRADTPDGSNLAVALYKAEPVIEIECLVPPSNWPKMGDPISLTGDANSYTVVAIRVVSQNTSFVRYSITARAFGIDQAESDVPQPPNQ